MKVLIVDDSPQLLNMLSALLDKEGFTLVLAAGGREALARHAQHKPEIVCLDVLMDDLSGIDVCREIRRVDKDASILMITSKSGDNDVARGMEAGADDYVAKPFDLSDLAARIKEIARARIQKGDPARFAETFEFGEVRVFPGQLRAERRAEGELTSVDLNFRDVNILRHLLRRRGQPVAAAELREFCWKSHPSGEDKAVDWTLSQLRKKIEQDPENPRLIRSAGAEAYIFG